MGDRIQDDPRARSVLLDAYWSGGWRWKEPDPEDFAHAKAAGYFYDKRAATHDEWIDLALRAAQSVTLAEAVSGFVASLSTRRLADRSALGSLATVRHLEPHPFRRWSSSGVCATCGLDDEARPRDLSVLSFERQKWGGVRHGDLVYAWLDLDAFGRSDHPSEAAHDVGILNAILRAARTADPAAHPRDLEHGIADVLPSNKAEREILLAILALSGALAEPHHPGLLTAWVPITDRQPPPKPSKNDWAYPMFWWRGSVGVDEEAARRVFGHRVVT